MKTPATPASRSAARSRRSRVGLQRRALSALALPAAALCLVLLAGCGGSSSSPGVAHLASNTPTSTNASGGGGSPSSESSANAQQKLVAFAQCMRTHGVPEFPEPTEGKLLLHGESHNGHVRINPQSSQFQAASKACAKLAPNGGKAPSPAEQTKMQEQALKFSECMRSHGVPNFPDPEISHSGGGVAIRIGGKNGGPGGIEPNSRQFQAAQKACQSILGGPKGPPGEGQAVAAAP